MLDISIDLETLDVIPSAHILSIGAAKFDIETGEIVDTFLRVMPFNGEQQGRTKRDSTIEWWFKQSDEARKRITSSAHISIHAALDDFRQFVEKEDRVWGNGATFDISILENAYHYNAPWKFYNVMDMRTLVRVAEDQNIEFKKRNVHFDGEQHCALDDARHQAKVIHLAYKALEA